MRASANASSAAPHTPVLYQEVLAALQPKAASRYIDGTLGAGGHAIGILDASSPTGQLLGIDRDPLALDLARERLMIFGDRVRLCHGSFSEMVSHARAIGWDEVDGIILDLGLSSMQISDDARGFSLKNEGPLDMRFDPSQILTAADIVNHYSERQLADLIWRYGEEPQARRIARAVAANRPLKTTRELAELIEHIPGRSRRRIHPATRTFQAIRIAVNDELHALECGLSETVSLLKPSGRVAVIAFHSLEDRLVKQYFRKESQECICPPSQPICTCGHHAQIRVITRRPIRPGEDEVARNPRSRSARLRVAERL